MLFFEYGQNNSGGSFDFDEKRGITHHVIIEADNAKQADIRAESIGLYWNGCDDGRDCPCCGDRWYPSWGDTGDDEPRLYGQPVAEAKGTLSWMKPGREIAVHYANGDISWFGVAEE